jgi:predicted DNA-binding transcriptional regulator YafY
MHQALRCSRLLREGWHDKSALARRLEVSDRAVKRYLRAIALEDDGFETRTIDERGLRQYRIRPPNLAGRRRGSPYEILALAMAERFFRAIDPGGVADLLDQVLFEVTGEEEDELDAPAGGGRRGIARRFVLARAPQALPGTVRHAFDRVLRGVVERRVLDLTYHPRTGPARSYVLRPYTLVLGEAELAVVGATGEPDEDGIARPDDPLRTFALHRIESIELRSTRFAMPHLGLWDPASHFAGSWGLYAGPPEVVRVAVHPKFAELVARRTWHPSQQVEKPAEDGWIRLRFEVFTGGEFRTWLLGWGPWLRVESPSELADWLKTTRAIAPGDGSPGSDEVFRIV